MLKARELFMSTSALIMTHNSHTRFAVVRDGEKKLYGPKKRVECETAKEEHNFSGRFPDFRRQNFSGVNFPSL